MFYRINIIKVIPFFRSIELLQTQNVRINKGKIVNNLFPCFYIFCPVIKVKQHAVIRRYLKLFGFAFRGNKAKLKKAKRRWNAQAKYDQSENEGRFELNHPVEHKNKVDEKYKGKRESKESRKPKKNRGDIFSENRNE
jgi:hypothetical protein